MMIHYYADRIMHLHVKVYKANKKSKKRQEILRFGRFHSQISLQV